VYRVRWYLVFRC